MLVFPSAVHAATYILEHMSQNELNDLPFNVPMDELRVSLAEAIQQAVEEWFKDLPTQTETPGEPKLW